jgi:hypothetical protein
MSTADAERIAQMTFFIVLLPIDLTKMVDFNPKKPDAAIAERVTGKTQQSLSLR